MMTNFLVGIVKNNFRFGKLFEWPKILNTYTANV